jgi:hypothetical protein
VFSDENATVLLFRHAAPREPVAVVTGTNAAATAAAERGPGSENVVSLARFAQARRARRLLGLNGPPEGEAA